MAYIPPFRMEIAPTCKIDAIMAQQYHYVRLFCQRVFHYLFVRKADVKSKLFLISVNEPGSWQIKLVKGTCNMYKTFTRLRLRLSNYHFCHELFQTGILI